ncbi:hypothetical protein ABZ719_01555 [Streptomyces sp. NPDC006743]|uniref:hypothetical protein n=1 Tax=Streptomyces sp. NPDC006743 TaxID=3154480 RepID=UPI003451666E
MSRLVLRFTAGFEAAYGYPPGEHCVLRSTDRKASESLAAALGGSGAQDLIDFYAHVARISLPDVGAGFFADEVEDVIDGLRGTQPTRVSGVSERNVVVFGSEGGGALFAADRQTGEIIRLEGGALVGSDYEVEGPGVAVIARDFSEFMQFLQRELLKQISSEG